MRQRCCIFMSSALIQIHSRSDSERKVIPILANDVYSKRCQGDKSTRNAAEEGEEEEGEENEIGVDKQEGKEGKTDEREVAVGLWD